MPIAYQNAKTGRVIKVLTPEEKASVSRGDAERDKRRQRKLVTKMDESDRWERVPIPDLVGRGAVPAPIVDEAPEDGMAEPVTPVKPEPDEAPSVGPTFTRVVKRS